SSSLLKPFAQAMLASTRICCSAALLAAAGNDAGSQRAEAQESEQGQGRRGLRQVAGGLVLGRLGVVVGGGSAVLRARLGRTSGGTLISGGSVVVSRILASRTGIGIGVVGSAYSAIAGGGRIALRGGAARRSGAGLVAGGRSLGRSSTAAALLTSIGTGRSRSCGLAISRLRSAGRRGAGIGRCRALRRLAGLGGFTAGSAGGPGSARVGSAAAGGATGGNVLHRAHGQGVAGSRSALRTGTGGCRTGTGGCRTGSTG